MLIFDSFPNRTMAKEFVKHVKRTWRLKAKVFDNQDESDAVDSFPDELTPPIVLVQRPPVETQEMVIDTEETEERIERSVEEFGGKFAGT